MTMTRWNPFNSILHIDPCGIFDEFFRSTALRPGWNGAELTPGVLTDAKDGGARRVEVGVPDANHKGERRLTAERT